MSNIIKKGRKRYTSLENRISQKLAKSKESLRQMNEIEVNPQKPLDIDRAFPDNPPKRPKKHHNEPVKSRKSKNDVQINNFIVTMELLNVILDDIVDILDGKPSSFSEATKLKSIKKDLFGP